MLNLYWRIPNAIVGFRQELDYSCIIVRYAVWLVTYLFFMIQTDCHFSTKGLQFEPFSAPVLFHPAKFEPFSPLAQPMSFPQFMFHTGIHIHFIIYIKSQISIDYWYRGRRLALGCQCTQIAKRLKNSETFCKQTRSSVIIM